MKTKISTFVLFLFLVTHFSYGQRYYSGYIVKDGNKINGLICVKAKKKGEYIPFKTTKGESPQEIKAEDLTEFYLSQFNARFFPVKETTTGRTVITELIREGKVDLYNREKLYVLVKDTATLQIYFPVDKAEGTNVEDVNLKKRLVIKTIGTLKNFLSECKELKIESVKSSVLKETVDNYNKCTNEFTPPVKTKGGIGLGVVAGLNMSSLKFKGDDFLTVFDFDPSIGYNAGVSLSFSPKKFLRFTSCNIQVLYNQQRYNGSGSLRSTGYTEYYTMELTTSSIRIPMSLRRYFSPGNEGIFVDLGFSPNRILNLESKMTYKGVYDNNSPGPSGIIPLTLVKENLSFSILGNVGFARRINKIKYVGTIKFEFDNGFAHFESATLKIFNTSLNLTVEF